MLTRVDDLRPFMGSSAFTDTIRYLFERLTPLAKQKKLQKTQRVRFYLVRKAFSG